MAGPIKIRLVDDNADGRDLLTQMLHMYGFPVIIAEDGCVGLKLAEAEQPDLIITDICMPRLDGIEMIVRMRKELSLCDVPILVISAYGSGELGNALSAGANMGMRKPVEFDSFITCVNRLLPARLA